MNDLKNIFIVDDDDLFSSMLSDYLTKTRGLRISVFSTGEECLSELYQNPFVVILDYNLNSVDKNAANGMAILEQIKIAHPTTHVIVLSSQSSYGVAASIIAKGAEQYIIKDADAFKNIEAMIKSYLKV